MTPSDCRHQFIEVAPVANAGEDEADFDAALKRIAKPKEPAAKG